MIIIPEMIPSTLIKAKRTSLRRRHKVLFPIMLSLQALVFCQKPSVAVFSAETKALLSVEKDILWKMFVNELTATGEVDVAQSELKQLALSNREIVDERVRAGDILAPYMIEPLGRANIIIWYLEKIGASSYRLDVKYFDVVTDPNSFYEGKYATLNKRILEGRARTRMTFKTKKEGLDRAVRRSAWYILGKSPPKDRFPGEGLIRILKMRLSYFIQSVWFSADSAMQIAIVAVMLGLLSYGSYYFYEASGMGEEGIGPPPEFPSVPPPP